MLWHHDDTWHKDYMTQEICTPLSKICHQGAVILQGTNQGQSPGLIISSSVTQNKIWIPSLKALLSCFNMYTVFQDTTLDYAGLIQSGNSDSNHELNLLLHIALNESDVLYCPHSEYWN